MNKKRQLVNDGLPVFKRLKFKSKVKKCGKCGVGFDTTPLRRFFCESCWLYIQHEHRCQPHECRSFTSILSSKGRH